MDVQERDLVYAACYACPQHMLWQRPYDLRGSSQLLVFQVDLPTSLSVGTSWKQSFLLHLLDQSLQA